MSDWKSTLINIKQQLRTSIDSMQNTEQQIQLLIDEIDSSPERTPAAIEAQMRSLMSEFGQTLYQELKVELSQEIGSIRDRVDQINKDRIPYEPALFPVASISPTYSQPSHRASSVSESGSSRGQSIQASLQKLIDDYNKFGIALTSYYPIIEVDETKDFIERRRVKYDSPVLLARAVPGKFWLIELKGSSYLLPSPKEIFNKHNLEVLKSLFLFQESSYYPGYKGIILESPAILLAHQSKDIPAWQLQAEGNISFIV